MKTQNPAESEKERYKHHGNNRLARCEASHYLKKKKNNNKTEKQEL